jgi:hypothetical protein
MIVYSKNNALENTKIGTCDKMAQGSLEVDSIRPEGGFSGLIWSDLL